MHIDIYIDVYSSYLRNPSAGKNSDGPPWFEKTRWKRKIAAPTASFSVKSGHHGFGGIGAVETTDREAGS